MQFNIVKNIMNDNWYLYNDASEIKQCYKEKQLQTNNAYMLFYYRHN